MRAAEHRHNKSLFELSSFFLRSVWCILLMSLYHSDRFSIQTLLCNRPGQKQVYGLLVLEEREAARKLFLYICPL